MIKINIEMPENCNECFACNMEDECHCTIEWKGNAENVYSGTKPDWCPIEEVE